jgi:hypothetical protein
VGDEKLLTFHKGTNKEKADPAFGIQVARSINASVTSGYSGYFNRRNRKISLSRDIAAGKQDMTKFLDLMNIDGKNSFLNLDLTPLAVAPKFIDIINQRFMERHEDVKVSAVDPQSKNKLQTEKAKAEFRMTHKDLIGGLQQESGIPMEDPNAYTPEDKDDLEFYFGYEFQLPEEIKFEKAIDYVLMDNDWSPVRKRRLLDDLAIAGLAVVKAYVDVNGIIRSRVCTPEDCFYSWSKEDDLKDISYCGELYKMKVTEFRARFNADYVREFGAQMAEEKLFQDVQKAATDCPGYTQLSWNTGWAYSYNRPYDDWEIEVMDFEFKTVDNEIFTAKTNSYGKLIAVDKREKIPQNLGENKELVKRQVYNIYRGYYVKMLDKLFCWELAKNMIRPQSNLSDVYFSFSFYMPKNRNMTNVTIPERMKTAIDGMTLAHLKIQQLQAKMRPAGISVDVSGLSDIDLGLGGTLSPLELQKVYDQTGNIYFRGVKEDGENRQQRPIEELANAGCVPQIQAEITLYNFYLDSLRRDIGTNEYTEGQSVNPKTGLGVMDNQIAASNRATEFIYEGYLSLMQNVCRNIGILLWDNIIFGGQQYRAFIGDDPIEKARFDVKIEMLPDEAQRAMIAGQIQAALTAGTIDFQDAFKINNIDNIKLKQLYLSRAQKRKRKEQMQDNMANIQANNQAQMQSAAATTQGKQAEIQLEMQGKLAISQMTGKGASEKSMQDFVQGLLMESFKQGRPLPSNLQLIVDQYFEDKANQEQEEQQMTDSAMEQQAAEQQQSQGPGPSQEGSQMPQQLAQAG